MLRGVRRRRGGLAWIWLLAGLLFGGAAGAGTVWLLMKDKGIPGGPRLGQADELALVPADAIGFVHFRARDLWKSEVMGEFRKIVDKAGQENLGLLDERFAPKPSTLDRVTLVVMGSPTVPVPAPKVIPLPKKNRPGIPEEPPIQIVEPRKPLISFPDKVEYVGIFAFTTPYHSGNARESIVPGAIAKEVAGKEYWDDSGHGIAAFFPSDTVLVLGTPLGVKQFVTKQSAEGNKPSGPLSGALEQAAKGKWHFVAAVNAQDFHINLKSLSDRIPNIHADASELMQLAKDAEPLLHAEAFSVSSTLDVEGSKIDIRAYFKDDSAADEGEKAVRSIAEFAHKKLEQPKEELQEQLKAKSDKKNVRPIRDLPEAVMAAVGVGALNHIEGFLANPPLKRDGKELIATFEVPSISGMYASSMAAAVGILITAVYKIQELTSDSISNSSSSNNLKQIALACLKYEEAHGHFPHDIVGEDGKPLLSWRVAILPFLEQGNLYQRFKLDEPWDSNHNKVLSDTMVHTYMSPQGVFPPGMTPYRGFAGPGAMFEPGKKIRLKDVTDGTSETILVVEAGNPIPWAKPGDIPFDPKKPLHLTFMSNRLLNVAMVDGSIHTYREGISEKTLKAEIIRNWGEVTRP